MVIKRYREAFKQEGSGETLRLFQEGEGAQIFPMGWSWPFFFFGWIFGIPFFMRKLYGAGILMALILALLLLARYYAIPPSGAEADRIADEIIQTLPSNASEDEVWRATWQHPSMVRASLSFVSQFLLMFAMIGLHLWLCFRGNNRVIAMHLKRGWRFADEDSERRWRSRDRRGVKEIFRWRR